MSRQLFTVISLLVGLVFSTYALVQADISGALYQSILTLTNNSSGALTNRQVDFPLSGKSLLSSGSINSTGLNSQMQTGGLDVASMPASDRLVIEGAVHEVTGSFTDFTSQAQSTDPDDVEIFTNPITGAQNFYFGCYTRCRIVAIDLSVPSDGNYTLAWTYWNGSTWVSHTNVSDGTLKFTVTGFNTVSWNIPTNWAQNSVDGKTAFWTRVELSSPVGSPPGPVADRIMFETGMWWTYLDSLPEGEQRQYTLFMGGPDMKTRHEIFTGPGGITADDHPSAELDDLFLMHWSGVLNFTPSGGVKCIVCKGLSSGDPFRLFISDSSAREVTVQVSGSDSIDFTVQIPEAVVHHTFDISLDAEEFIFTVGGVTTLTTGAMTVADTADNWFFIQNNSAVYMDRTYILADASSLAFEDFDTKAEWDTGVFSNTESVLGQQDFTITYIVENPIGDGFWCNRSANPSIFFPTSSQIRFGWDGTGCGSDGLDSNAFFLFEVDLSQGTQIDSAFLQFEPERTKTNITVNVRITAEAIDNATPPSSVSDAENRIRTSAFTDWNDVEVFTALAYPNNNQYDSADITSVIQEIINRPGWVAGNDILIFVEDNGSTTNNDVARSVSSVEDRGSAVKLKINLPVPSVDDDFIRDTRILSTPIGWTQAAQGGGSVVVTDVQGVRFGNWAARIDPSSGTGNFRSLFQNIPASEGQVWSASAHTTFFFSNDNGSKSFHIRWLDSGFNEISSETINVPGSGSLLYTTVTLNNRTAPASTAFARIEVRVGCTFLGCSQSGRHWDGIMACICATAPPFGDSANLVTNPSFEGIYQTSGTWTSPTLNPTNVNVSDSGVFWSSIVPSGTNLLVETSIDNQVSWQPVGNGESITGIDPGDDLTGTTLHVRITPSGPGPTTPIVSQLFVVILDDILDDSTVLFFELRDLPTGTLTDHSPFDNTGTMDFPSPLTQSTKTSGPITPLEGGAGGFPGFGNLPEGLEPTRPSLVGEVTQPSGFFAGCQDASKLPLFDVVNPAAGSLDWEACTLYEVLVLGISMVVSVGTYLASGHPILAILLGGAIMFGGVSATILSGWVLIVYGIVGTMIIAIARNI